jgi:arylamine N-acetyltransferase
MYADWILEFRNIGILGIDSVLLCIVIMTHARVDHKVGPFCHSIHHYSAFRRHVQARMHARFSQYYARNNDFYVRIADSPSESIAANKKTLARV